MEVLGCELSPIDKFFKLEPASRFAFSLKNYKSQGTRVACNLTSQTYRSDQFKSNKCILELLLFTSEKLANYKGLW